MDELTPEIGWQPLGSDPVMPAIQWYNDKLYPTTTSLRRRVAKDDQHIEVEKGFKCLPGDILALHKELMMVLEVGLTLHVTQGLRVARAIGKRKARRHKWGDIVRVISTVNTDG